MASSMRNGDVGVDEKNLKNLLDAFGAKLSLKHIASTYIEAGKDAKLTAQSLNKIRNNSIVGDVYTDHEEISEVASELSSSSSSGNSEPSFRNTDGMKMKSNPVSVLKHATAGKLSSKGGRSVKSDKRWVVKNSVKSSVKNMSSDPVESKHKEYEDFRFKMLQHGFRVDRAVIRQVLGECGCDLKKSLEKLVDLAAKNHHSKCNKVPERNQTVEAKSRTLLVESVKGEDDPEEEDIDYKNLRQAVKEYRSTRNVYYKAGAEASAQGDLARSIMLLEKGEFFHKKAREADKESVKRIFSSSSEAEETIPLNLENCTPKDASRLVKSHIRNFSGIATVKYLRITNGSKVENAAKNASRARMIIKLLERESINWWKDEDEYSESIIVSLSEIDPRRLTFALHRR